MTRIGSLCSGYGGLDLGLELALGPVEHAWHVEYDKHPSAILAHRFPGVPNLGDLTTLDYDALPRVDWLTAGYPCQPFSHAGKRKGKADERHLWPFVADAIGRLRPGHVLLENVRGHLSLGLADVLADLAGLGYDTRWGVVRAADAGAPHGRARVFIVASDAQGQRGDGGAGVRGRATNPVGDSVRPVPERGFKAHGGSASRTPATDALQLRRGEGRLAAPRQAQSGEPSALDRRRSGTRPAPDADGQGPRGLRCGAAQEHPCSVVSGAAPADAEGHEQREPAVAGPLRTQPRDGAAWGDYAPAIHRWEAVLGRPAPRPTEPGRSGERLSPRFVEWMMGLPAGWVTDVPGLPRNAQLKALGNGVVPQQAALALHLLGVTAGEVAA